MLNNGVLSGHSGDTGPHKPGSQGLKRTTFVPQHRIRLISRMVSVPNPDYVDYELVTFDAISRAYHSLRCKSSKDP